MSTVQLEAGICQLLTELEGPLGSSTLESVRWLLILTRDLLGTAEEQAESAALWQCWKGLSPDVLRATLRAQGLLERARCLEFLRKSGWPDAELCELMGFRGTRRLNQLLAVLTLPASVQTLIRRYALEERTLRPLLPWRRQAHFPMLVKWVGLNELRARQVEAWCKLLRRPRLCTHDAAAESGEALGHLGQVLGSRRIRC